MPKDRVGLAFHETFSLNLPAIATILQLSKEKRGNLNPDTIREETCLGANYVRSMPQYARACGLMKMGSYELTQLGELTSIKDPHLTNLITHWLMHYNLSTPQGPGPAFWSHLVTTFMPFGVNIETREFSEAISQFLQGQGGNSQLKERTIHAAATVFAGTYTKSDGLGSLGFLNRIENTKTYEVGHSKLPPLRAVAYALGNYWAAHFGEQLTVSLAELARAGGFGRVMWMDYKRFDEILEALRREGVIDLHRVAQPYQVQRGWTDSELIARLYDTAPTV